MPLPKPDAGESRADFMSRCLKDPATQDITGANADESQQRRIAACERQFDDAQKAGSDELETKAFGALEIKDSAKGEVAAIVATLNVVDKDGDVILPGAVKGEAPVKMSSYAHDVVLDGAAPVGIGVIREQGDSLLFKGRFFLSTERGREAFATVKELGAAGEWSFGFPRGVTQADVTKEWAQKGARRVITGITPIEASPVFVGAGVGTRTLSVKTVRGPTASVDGHEHPASDFACVPDPVTPSTWKLPIFDADHVRNALARFDQTAMPQGTRDEARKRILAAARRFGIDASSLEPMSKSDIARYTDPAYQAGLRRRTRELFGGPDDPDDETIALAARALRFALKRSGFKGRHPDLKWARPGCLPTSGRCIGLFVSNENTIWVDNSLRGDSLVQTVFHEAAHAHDFETSGFYGTEEKHLEYLAERQAERHFKAWQDPILRRYFA